MSTEQKEKTAAAGAETDKPQALPHKGLPKAEREHVAAASGDILDAQITKLKVLFPEIFVEGKIDFDKLKATLGSAAERGPGRFHFSWAGTA
jgi:hypothetical protein